jgi:hypothetical protein
MSTAALGFKRLNVKLAHAGAELRMESE